MTKSVSKPTTRRTCLPHRKPGYATLDGNGSRVCAQITTGGSTYYRFDVFDSRGTQDVLTDQNGNITRQTHYNAFGQVLSQTLTGPDIPNRFGYQTNWMTLKDSGRRLGLSPTRIADVTLARFLQPDLLFVGQWSNLYSMQGNGVDPSGLEGKEPIAPKVKEWNEKLNEFLTKGMGANEYIKITERNEKIFLRVLEEWEKAVMEENEEKCSEEKLFRAILLGMKKFKDAGKVAAELTGTGYEKCEIENKTLDWAQAETEKSLEMFNKIAEGYGIRQDLHKKVAERVVGPLRGVTTREWWEPDIRRVSKWNDDPVLNATPQELAQARATVREASKRYTTAEAQQLLSQLKVLKAEYQMLSTTLFKHERIGSERKESVRRSSAEKWVEILETRSKLKQWRSQYLEHEKDLKNSAWYRLRYHLSGAMGRRRRFE